MDSKKKTQKKHFACLNCLAQSMKGPHRWYENSVCEWRRFVSMVMTLICTGTGCPPCRCISQRHTILVRNQVLNTCGGRMQSPTQILTVGRRHCWPAGPSQRCKQCPTCHGGKLQVCLRADSDLRQDGFLV